MSIHRPDRAVEWPSQLLPPYVAEVSQPLRAWNPAFASAAVRVSRVSMTPGAISGSSVAVRP
ncbi:hypothetical protein SHKM778_76940 [Streptomyces sp. KM77-8]|uniref:Uncharacterized protein n=1 Tax=Streptomyces haneummycinicus TaxID=3074435 RepID=A0AAT9HV90_9ACTN